MTANQDKIRVLWQGQIVGGPAIHDMCGSLSLRCSVRGYAHVYDVHETTFRIDPWIRNPSTSISCFHCRIVMMEDLQDYRVWKIKARFSCELTQVISAVYALERDMYGFLPVMMQIPAYDLHTHTSVRGEATLYQDLRRKPRFD